MKTLLALFLIVYLAPHIRAQDQGDIQKEFDRLCSFSYLYSDEEVGPGFSLEISFRGAPVAGAQIELEHEGKAVATARTNAGGFAHFSEIPPGKYSPKAADGLVFPENLVIKVNSNHGFFENVKWYWPMESIAYRKLRGRF